MLYCIWSYIFSLILNLKGTKVFRNQNLNQFLYKLSIGVDIYTGDIYIVLLAFKNRLISKQMDALRQILGGANPNAAQENTNSTKPDTAETIHISSLALLKMLKHGRAGVPMEVMGLMLGTFVDEYTIQVVDVFAMPQSGTGVSVEAIDPVFQQKMVNMLTMTGRPETVVGWYHSHPGFGCWLSSTDCNTQQSFEQLEPRSVAVVIDPIQSVKGKVVIDAFRLMTPQLNMMGGLGNMEPRQTTSVLGHLNRPSIQALIRGLDRHYYSINIDYRKNELEMKMLSNVHAKRWSEGLTCKSFGKHSEKNDELLKNMPKLAKSYKNRVKEEETKTAEEIMIENVGKIDPKRHLQEDLNDLMSDNVDMTLGSALNTIVF